MPNSITPSELLVVYMDPMGRGVDLPKMTFLAPRDAVFVKSPPRNSSKSRFWGLARRPQVWTEEEESAFNSNFPKMQETTGGFLKWWVSPTTPWVFLLKLIILGCEMGVPPFTETPNWKHYWFWFWGWFSKTSHLTPEKTTRTSQVVHPKNK